MSYGDSSSTFDPAVRESWSYRDSGELFALTKDDVEDAQLQALAHRFESLRPRLPALDQLAVRQGVERIETFDDAPPVFFDHHVYKSYPLGLVEKRQFDRMTKWLQRLTTHDLSSVSTNDIRSVDAWLDRLANSGLSVGHTSGTKGKLSFLPRSDSEWPSFSHAYFEFQRTLTGVDPREVALTTFVAAYRRPHYWLGARLNARLAETERGEQHLLYDHLLTADLLSLSARMQTAEARGELQKLELDATLLESRDELVRFSQTRDAGVERWLRQIGESEARIRVFGIASDLTRAALRGRELGITCRPTEDSLLVPGGGMKGYTDAPADWEELLMDFYGIDRICSYYGMAECLGYAPRCEHGFYHFYPYTLPIVLDEDYRALPRVGAQTGRLALFDFLAESYWGGFITGDRVTVHWDYACECGWGGPRVGKEIVRFSDIDGGDDDKLSCAGTSEAYNAFMDYVAGI